MADQEQPKWIDANRARAVQIGNNNLQLNVFAPPQPIARSRYPSQIRQHRTPRALIARQGELEEMARFCTDPRGGDYLYWKADPWSGKTALLAWFVLHPPADTCVIPFFVNGNSHSQNSRDAFFAVVIEQLATVLGEPAPTAMSPAVRESAYLGMLEAAAAQARRRGARLVLVVDGLDEDALADGSSIAALLPAQPAHGTRVIAAGRLHPPLPPDLPGTHPLRDPSIVRLLSESEHAQGIRHAAERELELLLSNPEARDVLCLITAAGGGLSSRDLAELTQRARWQVEKLLRSTAGRTFAYQPASRWPGLMGAPDQLVFAHSQLRKSALDGLDDLLDNGRQRLHAWADRYRAAGWPERTPEYLLRDYLPMLRLTDDLPRMIAIGLDRGRHSRILAASGTFNTAITEIATARHAVAQQQAPDVPTLIRLSLREENLVRRSSFLPPSLPAIWVLAGQPSRGAESMWAMPNPRDRWRAQDTLIDVLSRHAGREQIVDFANQATRPANGEAAENWKVAELAAALTRSGLDAEAESFINRHTDPSNQRQVREQVALANEGQEHAKSGYSTDSVHHAAALDTPRSIRASDRDEAVMHKAWNWARSGNVRGAEDLARSIEDPAFQAWALIHAVEAAVRADDAATATDIARTIRTPRYRANALARAALAAAERGDASGAGALASEAETAARAVAHSAKETDLLAEIAIAFASAGRYEYAAEAAQVMVRTALACPDLEIRGSMMCTGVRALAAAGRAASAEQLARAITAPGPRDAAFGYAAQGWIAEGDFEHARELVRSAALPDEREAVLEDTLVDFAEVWASRAAQGYYAPKLGKAIEHTARSVADPADRALTLSRLALGWAHTKQRDRAEAAAADAVLAASEVGWGETLENAIAAEGLRVCAITGSTSRNWETAHKIEAAAWAAGDMEWSYQALETMVEVWIELGNNVQAERLAERLAEPAKSLSYISSRSSGKHANTLMARAVLLGGPGAANLALARHHPDSLLEIANELAADSASAEVADGRASKAKKARG